MIGLGTIVNALAIVGGGFIAPLITGVALSHISYVGNVLILCVGVNLIWPKTIRVANLLPAILIAVFYP